MGRTYLYSHLQPDDWEAKAGGNFCLVCDGSKRPDDLCCGMCWALTEQARQTQIINLLRQGRVGWALRKLCSWAGRASMPTRRQIKLMTGKLFEEMANV